MSIIKLWWINNVEDYELWWKCIIQGLLSSFECLPVFVLSTLKICYSNDIMLSINVLSITNTFKYLVVWQYHDLFMIQGMFVKSVSLVNVSPICNFYDWCLCKDVRPMRLVIPCYSQGNQNDGWFGKYHDQITSDLRSQKSFH